MVRHEFGVYLQAVQALRRAARVKFPVHVLDAGVNVGAVHGVEAGMDECRHVGQGTLAVNCAMIARQLPAAADDAWNAVTRCQFHSWHDAGH